MTVASDRESAIATSAAALPGSRPCQTFALRSVRASADPATRFRTLGLESVLDGPRDHLVSVARYQLTFGERVENLSLRLDSANALDEADRASISDRSVH